MSRSRLSIITYALLILSSGLAAYYFYQLGELEEAIENDQNKSSLEVNFKQEIESIDSILLNGNYREAINAYKNLPQDSLYEDELTIRIDLSNKLLRLSNRNEVKSDTANTNTIDTLTTFRFATPDEVRQYDSLMFALDKAKAQIGSLNRQLEQRTKGSYLSFATKKGNTVHYVGQVKNEKANGRGVALYNTGSRYEGYWENNLKHGTGTFYWPDGEYYEGEYVEDQRHGKGTYYWPNGEKYVGGWANDERSGNGIFFGEDGAVVAQGVWKGDELVEVSKK